MREAKYSIDPFYIDKWHVKIFFNANTWSAMSSENNKNGIEIT